MDKNIKIGYMLIIPMYILFVFLMILQGLQLVSQHMDSGTPRIINDSESYRLAILDEYLWQRQLDKQEEAFEEQEKLRTYCARYSTNFDGNFVPTYGEIPEDCKEFYQPIYICGTQEDIRYGGSYEFQVDYFESHYFKEDWEDMINKSSCSKMWTYKWVFKQGD